MDNKEKILRCALDSFYAKGYDGAGVQEIVDMAGVSKPTLYYYFGSKKGLLEMLLNIYSVKLEGELKEALEVQEAIPERLVRVAGVYYRFAAQNRKWYLLVLALFYSGRESEGFHVVFPLIHNYYQILVKLFNDASDELGNMNGRQEQFAAGFLGMLDHYLMTLLRDRPDGENVEITDEQIHGIVHQFLYGIYS